MRARLIPVIAVAAVFAACGGAAKRAPNKMESTGSPKDQIRSLESQNRVLLNRMDLGGPAKPGVDSGKQPGTTSRPPQPASGSRCDDICRITASICSNAEHICRIAREKLPNDPWAKGKCDEANASCRNARARCDACRTR